MNNLVVDLISDSSISDSSSNDSSISDSSISNSSISDSSASDKSVSPNLLPTIRLNSKAYKRINNKLKNNEMGTTGFVICDEKASKFMLFNEMSWLRELIVGWTLTRYDMSNIANIIDLSFERSLNLANVKDTAPHIFTKVTYNRYQYSLDEIEYCEDNDVCRLSLSIISTINLLHKQGIWHRDIKPQNIMVNENRIHIIDYSHSIRMYKNNISLDTNMVTFTYRAPEIFHFAKYGNSMCKLYVNDFPVVYNEKVDVWAFGVVLFDLLCRKTLGQLVVEYYKRFQSFLQKNDKVTSNNKYECRCGQLIGNSISIHGLELNMFNNLECNISDYEIIMGEFLLQERKEYLSDIKKLFYKYKKPNFHDYDFYWSLLEKIFISPAFRVSANDLQYMLLDHARGKKIDITLPYCNNKNIDFTMDELIKLDTVKTTDELYIMIMDLFIKFTDMFNFQSIVDVSLAEVCIKYLVYFNYIQLFNINNTALALYVIFISHVFDIHISINEIIETVKNMKIEYNGLRGEIIRIITLPSNCYYDIFITNLFDNYNTMKKLCVKT